jgi:nuclear respiratory factor 1
VHTVQTLAEVGGQGESVAVDLNNVTEATLNQDGQLILTGEDGHGKLTINFSKIIMINFRLQLLNLMEIYR